MAIQIQKAVEVMSRIQVIQTFEEDRYAEIPGWDGENIDNWTDAAVLLVIKDKPARSRWFPISRLRKTEDGLSIYGHEWVIKEKGL